MKKFAVGAIDFFNNDLVIEIIESEDWKEALSKHPSFEEYDDINELFPDYDQSEAKIRAFNMDMMIDVKEIK